MPKIRRRNLPRALLAHLLDRVQQRNFAANQIGLFAEWCDLEPEVPEGRLYERFPGMIVCGEGELVKTFLVPGQAPDGKEV
jgi:hypothetical protein